MKKIARLAIVVSACLLGSYTPTVFAQTLTTLYQFGGALTDGSNLNASLVQGTNGIFFGTTTGGGTNGNGTVFQITSAGTLTTVYQFGGVTMDGQFPNAPLAQGTNGAFYGTTFAGGTNGSGGTVFQITTAGTLTTLYQFGGVPTDGLNPNAGLVQGANGNFYGTTTAGGTNGNDGTVFQITSAGTLTTVYQFGGVPTDGHFPDGSLVQGTNGNFYGTTTQGGTNGNGGTVFQITTAGTLTTLYQFGTLPTDGQMPDAALVQGMNGNFYGTTFGGGTNSNGGTVFQITPTGTLTTLYQFGASATDGSNITAGLVQAIDGDFYGTTSSGGTNSNGGTLFKITSAGTLTTLYQLGSVSQEGTSPEAPLVQGTDGNFYGTTAFGGTNLGGTVFQFDTGCLYAFSSTNAESFTAAGGSDSVGVTAPNGCDWTAVSQNGFITVTSGSPGSGNGTFTFSVAANTNTVEQDGSIIVAGLAFTVTEDAAACIVAPATTSASFTAAGSSSNIVITANGTNCAWTAISNSGFINVTGGSSGSGNGLVTYTVAANTNTLGQTGSMTVAGQTFTVTQDAAGCVVAPTTTSASFTAAGSSSNIVITANGTNCAWTAVSNSSFINVTGGSSGSSNGVVTYTVDANTNALVQTGTMTVAGQTFTVTQDAAACIVAPTTTSASFTAAGGSSNIVVTANGTNCAWTAVSNSSFINVTGGSSGSGNGLVTYTVAANTNTLVQTGTMTVAGQTFTVTQAAAACILSLDSTSASFPRTGGSSNIVVTANGTNCAWIALSNSGFITVTAGSSGSGNGVVSYTVDTNNTTAVQTGSITVAGQTYTISEAALSCSVAPATTAANFDAAGGDGNVNVISGGTNCAWTAVSHSSFITITAGSSGSGNGTVSYTVAPNTIPFGETGSMTIAGQTFTVTQAAGISSTCHVTLSPTTINLHAKGGTKTVKIKTKGTDCAWSATSNDPFITITSPLNVTGNGVIRFTVPGNTNAAPLSGTMTIAGQNVTVNQDAGGCNYTFGPKAGKFKAAGGPSVIKVKPSLDDCAWTAVSNDSFITIVGNTIGVGKGTVGYFVSPNTNSTAVTGTITIGGQMYTVTQAGAR